MNALTKAIADLQLYVVANGLKETFSPIYDDLASARAAYSSAVAEADATAREFIFLCAVGQDSTLTVLSTASA